MRITSRMMVVAAALMLSACGFHLRGQAELPFTSLYLEAPESAFTAELRRTMEANHVKLANSAKEADVVLNIVFERPEKKILSLAGNGTVSEYQLLYTVSLRAYDNQRREWIPAMEMQQLRNYSYNDAAILAKESEEALLNRSMRTDMVQQILRRLSHASPQPQ